MKINELKRLTKHNALAPISGYEFSKGIKVNKNIIDVSIFWTLGTSKMKTKTIANL